MSSTATAAISAPKMSLKPSATSFSSGNSESARSARIFITFATDVSAAGRPSTMARISMAFSGS